jgi:nicotinate-nucleotide--dimethylbenzimidazole phosphoribosyltransferase
MIVFYQTPKVIDLNNPELAQQLQKKLDNKTKPLGSLGRIEALALRIGLILGTESPNLNDPQLLVFAGDHGLVAQGVSAYPSDVTWQMVENFLAGGAAVSVLARQHGIGLTVVDCGVRHDFEPRSGLIIRKVGYGTADSMQGLAMTDAQRDQALRHGGELVKNLPGNVLLLGEMGIGNTSAASLLMSRLVKVDIADCTGAGTGLNASGVQRKIEILRAVLGRHPEANDPLSALSAFGGFEIATMVGAVLQAAADQRLIVVDGFITSAAVLLAVSMMPAAAGYCVFAHQSGEKGHALMLAHMQAEPLLDLGLRLGEGSGAAMAWPLFASACALLREMASFESAGVSRQEKSFAAVRA